ncbi:MAG: hypothetical protein AAGG45_04190 [Pseudomonadota bacterium]
MSSPANIQNAFAAVLVIATLSGCASTDAENASASSGLNAYEEAMAEAMKPASAEEIAAAERSDPLTRANFWAQEYQKDQANPKTALAFMQALRAIGSHDRAIEVGTSILPFQPNNYEILLEIGRSLLSDNQPESAARALVRSADFSPVTEAAPLAALGLAFDRMGRHDLAQEAYREALKREPTRISTLSNYGLSLALGGQLTKAEEQLRLAVSFPGADARVRQNLALILGLQGKFDEMVDVDPSAPRRTVEANRTVLRNMIIPTRSYESLADPDPLDVSGSIVLPTSPGEEMPDIKEVEVSETAMAEPTSVETMTGNVAPPQLIDEPKQAPKSVLRSRLRGTTG